MFAPARALASLLILACAVASCGKASEPLDIAQALGCAPMAGLEAVLDAPAAQTLLIGAADEAGAAAFAGVICLSAGRGETVRAAVALASAPAWLQAEVARWSAAGAKIELTALPAASGDRDSAQASIAEAVASLAGEADRVIVLTDADTAARRPLGLTGETWSPAGARLSQDQALSLLAMASPERPARAALEPFEDIPDQGAARAYDGLIEVAPQTEADADALRGRTPA